MPMLPPVPFCS